MNLFRKKINLRDDDKLDEFFQDIRSRSFEIKLISKGGDGKIIRSRDCDVIKLSSLNDILEKHFGVSMKNSIPFAHEISE